MSYEPTTWKTGDIVSSEGLNKIENGIASCNPLIIGTDSSATGFVLDKTWQEIYDAIKAGRTAVLVMEMLDHQGNLNAMASPVIGIYGAGTSYKLWIYNYFDAAAVWNFVANSADAHPSLII